MRYLQRSTTLKTMRHAQRCSLLRRLLLSAQCTHALRTGDSWLSPMLLLRSRTQQTRNSHAGSPWRHTMVRALRLSELLSRNFYAVGGSVARRPNRHGAAGI
jgi:hypothetical protein